VREYFVAVTRDEGSDERRQGEPSLLHDVVPHAESEILPDCVIAAVIERVHAGIERLRVRR
jgi:hypothetical protein